MDAYTVEQAGRVKYIDSLQKTTCMDCTEKNSQMPQNWKIRTIRILLHILTTMKTKQPTNLPIIKYPFWFKIFLVAIIAVSAAVIVVNADDSADAGGTTITSNQ